MTPFLILGIQLLAVKYCDGFSEDFVNVSRRRFSIVASESLATLGFLSTIQPPPCEAATPANPAEAIRRTAASIPGYGQTDVFYPESLLGTWKMKREVSTSGGLILEYNVRFLRSVQDDAVVADRGFNQAELERAIQLAVAKVKQQRQQAEDAATINPVVVRSYEWSEQNPNDLRLVFSDGSRKEIKVTKRATEMTDSTVSCSEFQRVTQENERGIPIITARRVLTKWKLVDDSTVEGIELVYDVGGGDPLSGMSSSTPQLLSKSVLYLTREA